MQQYQIIITPAAEEKITQVFRYILEELQSPLSASHWLTQIEHDIFSLSDMPKRTRLVEEEPWHSRKIHRKRSGKYLIYYTVDDSCSAVFIIAIAYQRQDQAKILENIDT